MPKRKQNVKTSWAGQYAREASNKRFLNEVNNFDEDILKDIYTSDQNTQRLLKEIADTEAEIQWMKEDPEGYLYEKEQQELESKPKTLDNYLKNWWNSHGRRMNDFQIWDFQGYIDRANQWSSLADSLQESWDIEDRVNQINQEMERLSMIPTNSLEEMDLLSEQIENLRQEQKHLVWRHNELEPSVEAFKSYIPGSLRARYYDLMAGNGENFGFSNNAIFGRTSQVHDEMGDILRYTATMFNGKRSREEQRGMLKRALDERDKKIKEWLRGIDLNIQDRESYGKVDRWFEQRERNATGNIFDKDTWLYQMPGLIAGSTSGASKIVPAMLIGLGTGGAAAAATGVARLGIMAAGAATAFPFNYGAGVAENNAEVASTYNERIEDYLKNLKGQNGSLYDDIVKEGRDKLKAPQKMSDGQIFEMYRRGDYTVNNAQANKKMRELAIGIENQHQDDMAATTWGAGIETALSIIPFGKVISTPRVVRYLMLKTAARREALRNGRTATILNDLSKGFEIGSSAGIIGGLAYAPIHLAVSPTARHVGRVGKSILDDISKTAHIANDIPSEVLGRHLINDTRKRYIKDLAGRWMLASATEGIEEGKQSISANRYKNGEYTDAKIKSIGETILDDFLAGSKSAGLLLGMPFEDLMSESDRKILREIKGGLLVGGLLTAVVNVAQSIAPYRTEQSVNTALINSALIDKATKIDKLNKARIYAEAAKSSSAFQNMIGGFERLKKQNLNEYDSTGEYAIPLEHIDEELNRFKQIALLANDGYSVKQAEAQGIEIGSDEYNNFIAAKALARDELNDAQDVVKAANENFRDTQRSITEAILTQRLKESSVVLPGEDEQFQQETPTVNIAEHTSVENYNLMLNVANYAALLRRKQLLEVGILNAERGGHTEIKNILNLQLTDINDNINNLKKVIEGYVHEDETIDVNDLESVEKYLVLNKQDHDDLSEAYRQTIVANQDLELALSQYEKVVGKAYLNDVEVTPDQQVDWDKEYDNITFKGGDVRSVLKQIQDTIDDDDDLSSVIEEDFENRTDDEGNEIITPQEAAAQEQLAPVNDPEAEFIEDTKKNRKLYTAPITTIKNKPVKTPETTLPEQPAVEVGPDGVLRQVETEQKLPNLAFTSIENVYYGSSNNPRMGTLVVKPNEEGTNIKFEIDGKKQAVVLKGTDWKISDDSLVEEIGTTQDRLEELEDLGVTKDSEFRANRIFRNRDGNWYAEGQFIVPDGLPVDGFVQLADDFNLQSSLQRYVSERNLKYENKIKNQPPTPPVPPSAPTQFSEPSDEQRKTIEALNKRAEQSKKYVKDVTPDYYLIEVNGTEIKMPRVHSVMPEYWADYNMFPPALQVGNAIDNLARIFFGDKANITLYETNKKALIDKLANEYASHKDNPNDPSLKKLNKLYYRDLFNRSEQFEKTIDDLYNLFKEYQKLGWELSTEPIVWYSQFTTGWVAGETDMIAVDRYGNIHVIDFKTAMGDEGSNVDPFGRYTNKYTYKLPQHLEDRLLLLDKSDFTVGPRQKGLSKTARQLARDIRKAQGTNKIIITWDDDAEQAVTRYIESDYSNPYSSQFRVTHEFEGKQKGSKEDEYSDQLTAYMEMIQRNLFNVVDMEVVGFRASYNYDGEGATADLTSINSVRNERYGKPFRVKVFDSAEMKYILNNEGSPVEVVSDDQNSAVDVQEKNDIDNSTKLQEQQKADQYLPKDLEPVITLATLQTLPVLITGYSNLNTNVVNQHKDLVNGAVFDKQFIDELISNGSAELYTEDVKGKPTLYANITYKGKEYKRIYIYGENTGLLAKVQQLESKKQPGQKIVATKMSRTAGVIKSGDTKSVLDAGLIDESVEHLLFTSSSKTFGYVKGGNVVAFVGDNLLMQDSIYLFVSNAPVNGTLVYLKKLPRSTSEGADAIVPITIGRKTLLNDGDFIIECLKNIDTLNLPYMTVVDGKDVSVGATRRELLNLLIPYVEDINSYVSTYGIVRNPNTPSIFYIINNKKLILAQIDLRNAQSVLDFKSALLNFYIEEQHPILVSKLNGNNAADVFKKIYKFFANNKNGVKSLSISDSLKFDFEDFSKGLTGLGWYVKHGIFVTNYAGFDSPKISINDAGYIAELSKPAEPTKPSSIDDITPQQGFNIDDLDFTNWGGLSKVKTDEKKPLLTEETIKKHLRPILGDIVDDPSVVRVISTLSNDPRITNAQVVGKATADAITLYNAAFEGVDYHEAFHRIFELFVPKTTRDSIYNKVAARLGIDLNNSNKDNNYVGHRQVAEWIADKYMDFRKYNVNTGIQWLDRIINYIVDTVRAICSINNRDLYKVFLDINSGKYRNLKKASKENIDRFNTLFGGLHYEIHSTNFVHIVNDAMYEELKNSMFYCMLLGLNIDVSGSTVQNTQITRKAVKQGADRLKAKGFDIFGTNVEPTEKTAAQLAMTEMVVKFDAIADDLAAMMASISTDYRKIMQDEGREDADGGESQSSYDENFFKDSYEFDKFDKTSSRVKFFFATIPDLEFADDSHKTYKFATNSLGLPLFIPMNYVFNEVLSSLWDVDTLEEVMSRLSDLAMQDPMYAIIYNNLTKVIRGRTNADNEALLTLLMTTIRSNRHTFMLLRSVLDPEGLYNLVLLRSDADYNARVFPLQWSLVLAKGGSETLKVNKNGQIIFNPKNKQAVYTFAKIAKLFNEIQQAVSEINGGKGSITIPEYNYSEYEIESSIGDKTSYRDVRPEDVVTDITDQKECNKVKAAIVNALNHIGINIHIEELDFMLRHKYGHSDWESLKLMVLSTDEADSIGSFVFFLNNIIKDGKLNLNNEGQFVNSSGRNINFDNIFSDMAFVKELGNWKYEYRHAHDQLSVLATGGNRFYEMSDNDYMSDVLRSLNKRGKWFDALREDPYNYFVGDIDNFGNRNIYGSLSLKLLSLNSNLKLALKHFIGFKTDKKGDEGLDYFEISRREDYLSKVGILENDGMISLTLSDKKKYVYITGIKLPGIDYEKIRKSKNPIVDLNLASQITYQLFPNKHVYNIQQRDDVVDQMISYAVSEYESILRNAVRLNDGHRKVANFDTNQQSVKFSSLLGIWEQTFDKDGNPNGEQYISFNDNTKSWEENLAIAEAYFFDRPIDELRALIGRLLTKRTEKELETAVKLGLIEKVDDNANPFFNYKNIGLNAKVIKSIKASYLASGRQLLDNEAESLAVVMYINDISSKAIMSGQEMERLFSGNPAFYKWKYDKKGRLVDRTVDELKRLGGLGSTGINNFTELTNIPSKYLENGVFTGKYRCAEVDNEMVSSPQSELIAKSMYEGQLRESLIADQTVVSIERANGEHESNLISIRRNKDLTELEKARLVEAENAEYERVLLEIKEAVCSEIDNKSLEQLEKDYPEDAAEAKIKAKSVSDALAKNIDVADGGAYISDTMCEMLLRMEGAYGKDIQEAFKILRGEVKADYLGQIEAYQKVLTSVIGNQKYTAFGRRVQNGVSVPYYHKMALFPIFECVATGRMSNIFDKMKEQGIDMLLVNSAVKVGSEGSKSIDWSKYREDDDPTNEANFSEQGIDGMSWKPTFQESFNFDTYDCEFDYLRKQLNTDPKEEELLRMGTLMQKVVFSNLQVGRTYKTQSGESITGKKLLDRIMNSSNQLSNIGVDKINKRFFVTNENGELIDKNGNVIKDSIDRAGNIIPARNSNERVLDIEKFSKEVSKMMSDRGADKNIMKALELVTTTAGKQLQIPLGAISNANWLESVLISSLNKEIVDVNTPGAFYIQRSVWAMQGARMYDRLKGNIHGRLLYGGKRLQMVNEEGSMDCVISIDFYEHILPMVPSDEYELDEDENYIYQKDKDGNYKTDKYGNYIPKKKMRKMTFNEARQWLLDQGIIGGKSNIVAYRIPTQAESSIHALRVVDVLPVVRDTIILPEEFTKITGSDFDIDKLGLSTINWDVKGKKASDQFAEGTEKYYQNLLIRDYITLLIDPHSQHILHRSIDNDTKLLKDVLEEIESSNTAEELPYGFYSLSTQTERKNDYITGKIGIGPFALNNNNHILTMLYGVKFKSFDNSIMTVLDLNDLSKNKDYEGNSILSWISALINAHVDIAKDPYVGRLNVNQFTYNLVNTLIRTGFGKKTFYFTTQPIMKELADAYIKAGSSYMADLYKSQYQLQLEAIEEVAKNRFGELKLEGWTFDEIVEGLLNPNDVKYKYIINGYIYLIFNSDTLKNNANKKFGTLIGTTVHTTDDIVSNNASESNEIHLTGEQVLMLMYFAYLQFNPYALSVSNLVKYSKIDTKKHGKSYIEQQVYQKGFRDLFYNRESGGLFEESGINRMAEHSYIALKTNNAISMTKNILKGLFLLATNAFDNAINLVLAMIGKQNSKNVDLYKKISLIIMASIKSEFINQYSSELRSDDKQYIRDLVSESEENLEYTQSAQSNRLKVVGNPRHDLTTYIGSKVYVSFEHEGTPWNFAYTILGYDKNTNELIVDTTRKVDNTGKMHLVGGKNTIYDRFLRLAVQLRDDPEYRDVLDVSGEPVNTLLRDLVAGNTFEYVSPAQSGIQYLAPEKEDTYPTLKFIKLFNALDQNGIESNRIIDAWDELLHDNKHPLLKKFAEDLVVYAFVTSGDQGGFTKFFKQVPLSWRLESGYADFIQRKLVEYQFQEIPTDQLLDAILNNWFDGLIVPKYEMYDKDSNVPVFITYSGERQNTGYRAEIPYPIILAALKNNNGMLEPSIDPETAPLFIKIPRRRERNAKDSQRRVTVYKRVSYGMRLSISGEWVHYPIYVKVEPKGNLLRGNYLMTEYGREDAINKEYTPSEEALKVMYKLGDFIAKSTILEYATKWGDKYALMIEDMNYRDLFVNVYGGIENKFNKALNKREDKDNNNESNVKSSNLTIIPAKSVDKKASAKGKISNKFIGFAEGIEGSSTAEYARQAGDKANVGVYSSDDTIFVSIPGLRGDESIRHQQLDKTIEEAIKALNAGATLVTDNRAYTLNSSYNEGEKRLAKALEDVGAVYSERVVDGQTLGIWTKPKEPQPLSTKSQNLPGPETKINIYAGTGENADLSNFAERPFVIPEDFSISVPSRRDISHGTIGINNDGSTIKYRSVEAAFQGIKSTYSETDYPANTDFDALRKQGKALRIEDFAGMSGAEARKNGRNITDLDRQSWDKDSSTIMKALLKLSFEQNPQTLQRLLATGNATLTHTQDKGKWGTEFPRLLMEVREELRSENKNNLLLALDNLSKLGTIKRVPYNYITSTLKDLDKKREDYDNTIKRSPAYISLLNMMDPFKRVADIKIRVEISDRLRELLKWLKDNVNKFDRININFANATNDLIRFYHHYLQRQNDFVYEYVREIYGVDPELEDMPLSSDSEWVENKELEEILNSKPDTNRPVTKEDKKKAVDLARSELEYAQGVIDHIKYNQRFRSLSEQDQKDLLEMLERVDKYTKLLNGLENGTSEIIINQYGVPQVVEKLMSDRYEYNKSPKQIEYEKFFNTPLNKRFEKLAKVVFNLIDKFGIELEYDSELEVLGKFVRGYNKILVNPNHGSTNTILHECIHAVTSYYLDAYEDDKKSLPKEIQTAVEELKYCYDLLKNDAFETGDLTKDSPFLMYELGESDKYGLTNIHEFVAELSNPDFINRIKDYDKRHNSSVFDKLIDIIAKILGIKKEYKDVLTTSYQALKVLLEIPDKSLFDKKEAEIRTMKENLKKINTDTTITVKQNNRYKPIIDAIEKTEDERSEITVTMDLSSIDFLWHAPKVKDNKTLKGDIIKVIFNGNTGYIVLTKPFAKREDKFTEDEKPFEISFKLITAEFLQSTSFKMNSNNSSFTQLSDETFDLLQKVYKNRKNNTELNRLRVESYVKAKTQGIYKFKDKLFAAWRAVGEINDQLGTTFEVEINETTLGVSVPSKSSSMRKNVNPYREYVDDSDVIFSLIYNETSEDSAKLILELNGYNTNDESVLIALGKLIKKLCKGE